MPTETFFRLAEEKRKRILDAAWDEFTAVSFDQVSINRIIRAADIPRGSFYQYFAGKEDLFHYLFGAFKAYVTRGYCQVLTEQDGDIFRTTLAAYDGLCDMLGTPDILMINRCLALVRVNPGMDMHKFLTDNPDTLLLDAIRSELDTGLLIRQDADYVRGVFGLCLLALAAAAVDSLCQPEHKQINRERLLRDLEIIQYGSARAAVSAVS